jgi:hypothetical protein
MSPAVKHTFEEFLGAVAEEVSPPLASVDFATLLQKLVTWAEAQKPPLEQRTNQARTTVSYVIPENNVIVWRVAPRMKDGAKVEVLPAVSTLLPARARDAIAKLLEILSPGTDLEPDRRFMIPLHNLLEPKSMKQFLGMLDVALRAARKLNPSKS